MKIEINIPSSVSDITIAQYIQHWHLVKELKEDDSLNQEVRLRMVSIFCGVSMETVRLNMKFTDVSEIADSIIKLLSVLDVQSQEKPSPIISHYETEFGFIPKFADMTGGEFADLSSYVNDFNKLINITGILYRPVTEKDKQGRYLITKYKGSDENYELMKSFPAVEALRAYFFVVGSFLTLTNYSQTYLKEELQKELKKGKQLQV